MPKTKMFPQSAKTGRIVKLSYARKHPSTTFVQKVPTKKRS